MSIYVLAWLLGVVVGCRTMTGPAAVSWAARLGWISLSNTALAFMGSTAAPWIWSVLALGEIVNDKLPKTPSRKAAGPFLARAVMGTFCGYALGAATGPAIPAAIAGLVGAIAGALGGYEFRMRLAKAIGKDLPAALIEDVIAIAAAWWIVTQV